MFKYTKKSNTCHSPSINQLGNSHIHINFVDNDITGWCQINCNIIPKYAHLWGFHNNNLLHLF